MLYSRHLRAGSSMNSHLLAPGLLRCAPVIKVMTGTQKFQEIQPVTHAN